MGRAKMPPMALFQRTQRDTQIEIRGGETSIAGDWFHLMLRAPWWFDLLAIAVGFLFVNVLFALGYLYTGGIVGARPGSFGDLFFFSVQTMGTIGYGTMFPAGLGAHVLTTCEALVGILVVALSTGIVFSKFSVVRARVRFATQATIAPMNGVPMLSFRIGHERSSSVVDVMTRVVLTRTERTSEGVLMYRMYDLVLERDRAPALSRAWTIMHRIDEASPLHGANPATFKAEEFEFIVSLNGIDETSNQTVHARRTYTDDFVQWGARHADMLSERPDGVIVVDMGVFGNLTPTLPTPAFPYPQSVPILEAPDQRSVVPVSTRV
jgi:inward rectifier potassium channel